MFSSSRAPHAGNGSHGMVSSSSRRYRRRSAPAADRGRRGSEKAIWRRRRAGQDLGQDPPWPDPRSRTRGRSCDRMADQATLNGHQWIARRSVRNSGRPVGRADGNRGGRRPGGEQCRRVRRESAQPGRAASPDGGHRAPPERRGREDRRRRALDRHAHRAGDLFPVFSPASPSFGLRAGVAAWFCVPDGGLHHAGHRGLLSPLRPPSGSGRQRLGFPLSVEEFNRNLNWVHTVLRLSGRRPTRRI